MGELKAPENESCQPPHSVVQLKDMKGIFYFICTAILFSGCSDSRWYHAFELDEHNFDSDAMQMVKEDSQLALPNGTRGLNFRYSPPMDPSFIARLAIPAESLEQIRKQIEAIKNERINIAHGLPESTAWWTPSKGEVIIDRQCHQPDSDYFRVILTREGDQIILYFYHAVF